jgi:hypothetical protein
MDSENIKKHLLTAAVHINYKVPYYVTLIPTLDEASLIECYVTKLVCDLTGHYFSLGSYINNKDHHNKTEILLEVQLKHP